MAVTGSQLDIAQRLKSVIPASWFPDPSTNEWGFLQGFANMASWAYGLIAFAKLQTRISTASGIFLDIMALDFFGRNYRRGVLSDTAFRAGIKKELLRLRGTRPGLVQALVDLTGRAPKIFYPALSSDAGGYGYACGYGLAVGYGSLLMPYQCLVVAYRPSASGIPSIPGYGVTSTAAGSVLAGYSSTGEYADMSGIVGAVTDAQIYATIAANAPIGVIPWTRLSS